MTEDSQNLPYVTYDMLRQMEYHAKLYLKIGFTNKELH